MLNPASGERRRSADFSSGVMATGTPPSGYEAKSRLITRLIGSVTKEAMANERENDGVTLLLRQLPCSDRYSSDGIILAPASAARCCGDPKDVRVLLSTRPVDIYQ
jgi:hypothetical protein